MAFFPMFVDLTDQDCLVVGGGRVALRKVQVLLDFDARVIVVANEICDDIRRLSTSGGSLLLYERSFEDSDITGKKLVVAATSDETLNDRISNLCDREKIPVNVVDDKKRCSFIFPSYIKEKDLVGAFSSGGNSPVLARYIKDNNKNLLTPLMGELGDVFGKWRMEIIRRIPDEKGRIKVFETLISLTNQAGRIPTDEEIEGIIAGTFSDKNQ